MRQGTFRSVVTFAAACLLLGQPAVVNAQTYPVKGKPITLLVGFGAGGSSDAGARILAAGMEKVLDTKIEVVNKPGASGQIAYTTLAKAKPDGYTFGVINLPGFMVSYLDPDRKAVYSRDSFQPLALQVVDPAVIAVRADSPYKTLKDVLDDAKARPKKVTITTTGLQTGDHFSVLQTQKVANAQFAIVHFDGASTAMTALLGKKVDVYCGNVVDIMSQFKSGDIRVLGIMDKEESPFLPGVKTFTAQGYPVLAGAWRGYMMPAGTPKTIVQTLSNAIKQSLESPEVKAGMEKLGVQVRYMDPEGYASALSEYASFVADLIPLSKQ